MDVVRGVALLGILLMNILAFGMPLQAYFDPSVDGAVARIDFGIFVVTELLVEGAMRALFSMLFGAGVVILASGERAKGAPIYYRRQGLLLGIGLLDAFVLLWFGDILVPYALAGMALYFARNWRPRRLVIAAGLVFAYLAVVYAWLFLALSGLPEQAREIEARIASGAAVTAEEQAVLVEWVGLERTFSPPEHVLARHAAKFKGTYLEAFAINAEDVIAIYANALPQLVFWDVLACMLLGMALFKTGVLRGQRSVRFYVLLAIGGFAAGLAVNGFEVVNKVASGYALEWVSGVLFTSDLGRVAMALGFVSLVMIVCLRGWLAKLRRGLAAVGRMALTNYILQSVFGLAIFHDFGLGLWGELARHQLYLVVLAEWGVMIAFSVWWLGRYRFGPLEWLWRSLTYGHLPPLARVPGKQRGNERGNE